jgi:hypothetical protein
MTLISFAKAGIALPKVSAGLGSSVPAEPKTVANLRPKAGAPCGPNAGRGSCTVSDNWAAYVGGLITREGFEAAYGRPCTGAVGRPRQPSDQLRFPDTPWNYEIRAPRLHPGIRESSSSGSGTILLLYGLCLHLMSRRSAICGPMGHHGSGHRTFGNVRSAGGRTPAGPGTCADGARQGDFQRVSNACQISATQVASRALIHKPKRKLISYERPAP